MATAVLSDGTCGTEIAYGAAGCMVLSTSTETAYSAMARAGMGHRRLAAHDASPPYSAGPLPYPPPYPTNLSPYSTPLPQPYVMSDTATAYAVRSEVLQQRTVCGDGTETA
eukprot:3307621-Rhodomonas_salina.3